MENFFNVEINTEHLYLLGKKISHLTKLRKAIAQKMKHTSGEESGELISQSREIILHRAALRLEKTRLLKSLEERERHEVEVENFHTFNSRVRLATIELIGAQVAFQEHIIQDMNSHIIQDMNSDPETRGTEQVANEIALKRKYKSQKRELSKLLNPVEIAEITQAQRTKSLNKHLS